MDSTSRDQATWQALRRQLRITQLVMAFVTALLVSGFRPSQADVLTARGLVITDEVGRPRIVLGAPLSLPLPDPRFANSSGIALLDSLGRLQVALGRNNPLITSAGTVGSRIAAVQGLTVYDPRSGIERGGMGAFADGRVNLCLDWERNEKEAACMAVGARDRFAAVLLNGTPTQPQFDRVAMYVDADGIGSVKAFGGGANRSGAMLLAGTGPLRFLSRDSAGVEREDTIAPRPRMQP